MAKGQFHSPKHPIRQKLLRCLLLACIILLLNLILRQVVAIWLSPLNFTGTMLVMLFSSIVTLLLPALLFTRQTGMKTCFRDKSFRHSYPPALCSLLALSGILALNGLFSLLVSLFSVESSGLTFEPNGITISVLLLVTAAVPAFCEEFVYRGVMMSELREWGAVRSIVLTSLIFGLLHLSGWNILFAFLGGLLLGWLRHVTGVLIFPILVHFLQNAASVINNAAVIAYGENAVYPVFISVTAVSAVTAVISLLILIRIRRTIQPSLSIPERRKP